jgi:phage anti-repressor protein
MKKISINKDLVRLTPEQFQKWFENRQEKGKFSKDENWEKHYEALQPKKESKKKSEKK